MLRDYTATNVYGDDTIDFCADSDAEARSLALRELGPEFSLYYATTGKRVTSNA